MFRGARKVALGVVAAGMACTYQPVDGTLLETPFDVVEVSGFALAPSAVVRIEARNYRTGGWDSVGAATAGITATTRGHTTLYGWATTIRVAAASAPTTLCRWDKSCTITASDVVATLRIRVPGPKGGPMTLFAFDAKTMPCIMAKLSAGETDDFATAYVKCQPSPGTEIHLRVIT